MVHFSPFVGEIRQLTGASPLKVTQA